MLYWLPIFSYGTAAVVNFFIFWEFYNSKNGELRKMMMQLFGLVGLHQLVVFLQLFRMPNGVELPVTMSYVIPVILLLEITVAIRLVRYFHS